MRESVYEGRVSLESGFGSALTATDGGFVIEQLVAGRYTLVVEGPDGTTSATVQHVEPGQTRRVVLRTLGSIAGRVTTNTHPVDRFQISCRSDGASASQVVVDSTGSYSLDHVRPGRYRCEVTSDAGRVSGTIDVGGSRARLDLEIEQWATFTGSVIDMLTGQPLPGAYLSEGTIFERLRRGSISLSDANGRFRITEVPAGASDYYLIAIVLASWRKAEVVRELEIKPGQTLDLGVVEIPAITGPVGVIGCDLESGTYKVVRVISGGSADVAGIRVGDIVRAINDRPMKSHWNYWPDLFVAGQTYKFTLDRGVTVTVVAQARVR